jgi:ABC-type antimicrobial peptide transport system permease subunit
MNLAIRSSQPPLTLIPAVRRAISDTDPGVVLASVEPFDTFLGRPLAQPRLNALLLAVFAGSAALLAVVGLFGVMATMVRQRTRELGVRLALGATAHDLQRMVVQHGLYIAAIGSTLGLVGALLVNRLLGSLLYEVSPTDGATLGVVTALLLVSALVASFVPARACTRIEPLGALRQDV